MCLVSCEKQGGGGGAAVDLGVCMISEYPFHTAEQVLNRSKNVRRRVFSYWALQPPMGIRDSFCCHGNHLPHIHTLVQTADTHTHIHVHKQLPYTHTHTHTHTHRITISR